MNCYEEFTALLKHFNVTEDDIDFMVLYVDDDFINPDVPTTPICRHSTIRLKQGDSFKEEISRYSYEKEQKISGRGTYVFNTNGMSGTIVLKEHAWIEKREYDITSVWSITKTRV